MPRLLLVDDNPSIHGLAEKVLGPTDIRLVCLCSGEEVLRSLKIGDRFDGALIDISMPGMDGWELLDRLRAHPACARMPIALMAGLLDVVDQDRIKNAPIQAFLRKPVDLKKLPDRIRRLLMEAVVDVSNPETATVEMSSKPRELSLNEELGL